MVIPLVSSKLIKNWVWVVFLWMCSSVHFSWLNPCANLAPICTHCPHSWFMQIDFTLNSFWWVHPTPIPKFTHLLFIWELRNMPWVCIPLQYWIGRVFLPQISFNKLRDASHIHHCQSHPSKCVDPSQCYIK